MPRRRRYLRTHSFREAARAFLEPEPEAAGESLARLSISEVVRALHAGEDLARLSGLLQTAIGAQSELPPPGESLAPPVDGGASGPASIQRPLRMASPRPTRMRTLAARIVKLASGPTKQVREAIPEDALERLLDGPERDIEIARGALLVAREDEPKLDVGRSLDRIGKLARSLKERLAKASPDPWERLAVMNDFFFDDEGFRAEAIVDPERRLDDLHLARVLARRRGHCLGLSVLYLALGDRAGLPLFGVSCPRHFFVRYDDGKGTRINLEMTLQGASTPDSYYMERYRISPLHVDQGLYLGNLAKKQVLVELLNNRANCYWDQGDAARASRDLDRVARASRSFAPGFFARGFLAFEKGDVSTAVSELRRAIAIDPFYTRAYLHLAYAYLKAGSLEKAEVELVRAIDLDPQSALAHTNLGRVHARRGKQEAAIASHRKALELDPLSYVAWNNLGIALRTAGDEAAARNAFEEALAIAPKFLAARENLARVQKDTRHALRAVFSVRRVVNGYREKLARSPSDDGIHAAFSRFLLDVKEDLVLAREHAQRACALAPDSPRACEALAHVERRAGDLPRAIRLLERAVELAPTRAGADVPRLRALLETFRADRGATAPTDRT